MNVNELLSRLEGVKEKRGGNKWVAQCPAHDDKTPSLAVTIGNNGCILLHDFGGCDLNQILAALRIQLWELDPNGVPSSEYAQHGHAQRRSVNTKEQRDHAKMLAHEALVVAIAAENVARGELLLPPDVDRLWQAASVFRAVAERP